MIDPRVGFKREVGVGSILDCNCNIKAVEDKS